jgi:hypothetical protein
MVERAAALLREEQIERMNKITVRAGGRRGESAYDPPPVPNGESKFASTIQLLGTRCNCYVQLQRRPANSKQFVNKKRRMTGILMRIGDAFS